MEIVTLVIQICIGLGFAVYGICALLRNRGKQLERGKFVLFLVCVFVGIFLSGHVVYRIL